MVREGLLIKEGDRVAPSAYAMQIQRIEAVLQRKDAEKWLAWIWFLSDARSPYMQMDEKERKRAVTEAVFGKDMVVPKEVLSALSHCKERRTTAEELLEDAIQSVHKMRDWLRSVDPNEEEYDVTKHLKVLSDLGKVVNSLTELEKAVARQLTASETYGGVSLNEFNS